MHEVKEGRKWSFCSEEIFMCVPDHQKVCLCVCGCRVCIIKSKKLPACWSEKVTELTLWFLLLVFLLLHMQTSLKVSFSLMTVSCANWMKMSASDAMRLQSVVCFCTNHHQYAVCVPLHVLDWVDPLSHQMITDTSNPSCVTVINASLAAPQISALSIQRTHRLIMLSVLKVLWKKKTCWFWVSPVARRKCSCCFSANHRYITFIHFIRIISTFLSVWADFVIWRWMGWWMAWQVRRLPNCSPLFKPTNSKTGCVSVSHHCVLQLFSH